MVNSGESPEKLQSKKGLLKSKLQKLDTGNVSNAPPSTPETEVSLHDASGGSQSAIKDRGGKSGEQSRKLGPKGTPVGQPSIFDDTSDSDSEPENTPPDVEPGNKRGNLDVHKLADEVFKPFGSRSRAGSTAESDAAFCKGGPSTECGVAVGNRDEALQCDKCDHWFHCACQGVPSATYRVAGAHKSLSWLCTECKASIRSPADCCKTLKEKIAKLEASIQLQLGAVTNAQELHLEKLMKVTKEHAESLENALQLHSKALKQASTEQARALTEQIKLNKAMMNSHKMVTKEQENQKRTYADILKNECHEVMKTLQTKIENSSAPKHNKPSGTTKEVAGILDQFMDKERRKCNIVVHNLKEAVGDTHDDRMAGDRSRLEALFREAFHMQVRITNSFRDGKFNPEKPRLLIVTLESEATKWELIKLAPQLKNFPGFTSIYINPDRTKEEREQGRKLREELAARREKGEQNLVIRKGKIINVSGTSPHVAPGSARTDNGHPLPDNVQPVMAGSRQDMMGTSSEPSGSLGMHTAVESAVKEDIPGTASGAAGQPVVAEGPELPAASGDTGRPAAASGAKQGQQS